MLKLYFRRNTFWSRLTLFVTTECITTIHPTRLPSLETYWSVRLNLFLNIFYLLFKPLHLFVSRVHGLAPNPSCLLLKIASLSFWPIICSLFSFSLFSLWYPALQNRKMVTRIFVRFLLYNCFLFNCLVYRHPRQQVSRWDHCMLAISSHMTARTYTASCNTRHFFLESPSFWSMTSSITNL